MGSGFISTSSFFMGCPFHFYSLRIQIWIHSNGPLLSTFCCARLQQQEQKQGPTILHYEYNPLTQEEEASTPGPTQTTIALNFRTR